MLQESWKQFFNEDYLLFSEEILTEERTKLEVGAIESLLQLSPGASILDFGCGQGRLSVPLGQLGYQVTCFDGSNVLLEEARRRAEAVNVSLSYRLADMRGLCMEDAFDAVINFGTAFGYTLNDQEDQDIVASVYKALKHDGDFLIDTENRDFRLSHLQSRTWTCMGGRTILSERKFDCATGRWSESMQWTEGDCTKRQELSLRLYAATEWAQLLRNVGFTVRGIFGGLSGQPLSIQSPRMVIWAKK